MTAPTALVALDGADAIPLAVLRRLIGWNRQAQRYAVAAGLIRPLPGRGPHGGYQVTRADAITLLAAAALAPAAGVAVVSMLRTVRAAGLSPQDLAAALTGASQFSGAAFPGGAAVVQPRHPSVPDDLPALTVDDRR